MAEEQDERLSADVESGKEGASRVAASVAFGFYLVLGLLIALLVVAAVWILVSLGRESVVAPKVGTFVPAWLSGLWVFPCEVAGERRGAGLRLQSLNGNCRRGEWHACRTKWRAGPIHVSGGENLQSCF